MRVLIVEDDELLARSLAERIGTQLPHPDIVFARSHTEAIEAVDSRAFDAAVVDLRLPSQLDAGDATLDFGLAVEAYLVKVQPGAFRLFLTASDAKVVVQRLRMGQFDDFFSNDDAFAIVDYVQKEGVASLDECVDRLKQHHARLAGLDSIRLDGAEGFDLDSRRALAITVRIAGGSQGRVLRQDGLSSCVTALVACLDDDGRSVGNAFCKSGPSDEIDREYNGYRQAEFQLPSTVCPKLARVLHVGIGRTKALVFTKAPTSRTFFDLVEADPARAAVLVERLPATLEAWRMGATTQQVDLGEAFAFALSEAVSRRFEKQLQELALHEFVGSSIELIAQCQHGDLHGANLFVTDGDEPFLIDFAHTGVLDGPVDPASLELSFIFHPVSPVKSRVTQADCEQWLQDDHPQTIEGIGPIVAACRSWARQCGHDERAYAQSALAYALWMLNHAAEPDKALAIARSARRSLAT